MNSDPIMGYVHTWSVFPGQKVPLHVSSPEQTFTASLVRLGFGAVRGSEPALTSEHVPSNLDGQTFPGGPQALPLGSYLDGPDDLVLSREYCIEAWVQPRVLLGVDQVVWHQRWSENGGLQLVYRSGSTFALIDDRSGESVVTLPPLAVGGWYRIRTAHASDGAVTLIAESTGGERLAASDGTAERPEGTMHVRWGASIDGPSGALGGASSFNGKIAAIQLADDEGLQIAYDLAREQHSQRAVDVSGNGRHGSLVNRPTRLVTGPRWDGDSRDPSRSPRQFDAVWFHDDDLADACWPIAATLQLPAHLSSGVYAVRVRASDHYTDIPVFVAPRPGQTRAPLAVVLPTFSYLAYANERVFERESTRAWLIETHKLKGMKYPVNEYEEYVLRTRLASLYDTHVDGSGVNFATRARPLVNMRPDAELRHLAGGVGGPHQIAADLMLVGWLEQAGIPFDVLTDELVHEQGAALLGRYAGVTTGSHPEYVSQAIFDAFEEYVQGGGQLSYLGGNGFYWVVSVEPDLSAIELRRWNGTQGWAMDDAETHHQMTGESGGTWRGRGRAPQTLLGVGFCAQGFDTNAPYRKAPCADEPDLAWVFAGVDSVEFGADPSLINHAGAAGFEVDKVDYELGTPAQAHILASANRFSASYSIADEDGGLAATAPHAGQSDPRVRSDMVFYENDAGGAVFSVGSIAWCGSLWVQGGDGDVSRITGNVLRRFSESNAHRAAEEHR